MHRRALFCWEKSGRQVFGRWGGGGGFPLGLPAWRSPRILRDTGGTGLSSLMHQWLWGCRTTLGRGRWALDLRLVLFFR